MESQPIDFEHLPEGAEYDDTDVNLRAYLAQIPDEKLGQYRPEWSDEELMRWDGNFRDDDCLMIVCCFRDVEVSEYREALEQHLALRGLTR